MPIGGFAPLPIRLGGTPQDGWTAAQHAQCAATVAALRRTTPFAVLRYLPGTGVVMYRGRNGEGLTLAPTVTVAGTGDFIFTWPGSYLDDLGQYADTNISMAVAGLSEVGATAPCFIQTLEPTAVRVNTDGVNVEFTLRVWESPGRVAFGDYGGTTDKVDSDTEGTVPYAASWYAEIGGMLGDAYSQTTSGLVHARKLALARSLAYTNRAAESLAANARPGTSDARLGSWLACLGIPADASRTRWQLRQQAAAKFRGTAGNAPEQVDAALADLLGPAYVQSYRFTGADLATEPDITRWVGGTHGVAEFDINPATTPAGTTSDEAWYSSRGHLVVKVQRTSDTTLAEFFRLVNVDLFRLTDTMLPAWATCDWSTGDVTAGFLLDESSLDFDGL